MEGMAQMRRDWSPKEVRSRKLEVKRKRESEGQRPKREPSPAPSPSPSRLIRDDLLADEMRSASGTLRSTESLARIFRREP